MVIIHIYSYRDLPIQGVVFAAIEKREYRGVPAREWIDRMMLKRVFSKPIISLLDDFDSGKRICFRKLLVGSGGTSAWRNEFFGFEQMRLAIKFRREKCFMRILYGYLDAMRGQIPEIEWNRDPLAKQFHDEPDKKFVISLVLRQDNRRFVNEVAMMNALNDVFPKEMGYEVVAVRPERYLMEKQIAHFGKTHLTIAFASTALQNYIWMPQGAAFIAIYNPFERVTRGSYDAMGMALGLFNFSLVIRSGDAQRPIRFGAQSEQEWIERQKRSMERPAKLSEISQELQMGYRQVDVVVDIDRLIEISKEAVQTVINGQRSKEWVKDPTNRTPTGKIKSQIWNRIVDPDGI